MYVMCVHFSSISLGKTDSMTIKYRHKCMRLILFAKWYLPSSYLLNHWLSCSVEIFVDQFQNRMKIL